MNLRALPPLLPAAGASASPADADPRSSWKEGETKQAIAAFGCLAFQSGVNSKTLWSRSI
jgi:hypothetical protein